MSPGPHGECRLDRLGRYARFGAARRCRRCFFGGAGGCGAASIEYSRPAAKRYGPAAMECSEHKPAAAATGFADAAELSRRSKKHHTVLF